MLNHPPILPNNALYAEFGTLNKVERLLGIQWLSLSPWSIYNVENLLTIVSIGAKMVGIRYKRWRSISVFFHLIPNVKESFEVFLVIKLDKHTI